MLNDNQLPSNKDLEALMPVSEKTTVTYRCPKCGESWEEPLYTPIRKEDLGPPDLSFELLQNMFGLQCPSCCIPVKCETFE